VTFVITKICLHLIYHTELQNFLIAPRIRDVLGQYALQIYLLTYLLTVVRLRVEQWPYWRPQLVV